LSKNYVWYAEAPVEQTWNALSSALQHGVGGGFRGYGVRLDASTRTAVFRLEAAASALTRRWTLQIDAQPSGGYAAIRGRCTLPQAMDTGALDRDARLIRVALAVGLQLYSSACLVCGLALLSRTPGSRPCSCGTALLPDAYSPPNAAATARPVSPNSSTARTQYGAAPSNIERAWQSTCEVEARQRGSVMDSIVRAERANLVNYAIMDRAVREVLPNILRSVADSVVDIPYQLPDGQYIASPDDVRWICSQLERIPRIVDASTAANAHVSVRATMVLAERTADYGAIATTAFILIGSEGRSSAIWFQKLEQIYTSVSGG